METAQCQVWTWLQSAVCARRKFFVELKTWWDFFNRMKTHVSQHYQILYVLCVLVHSQGHFKTIDDMPIWGGAHPPALVAVLPGDKEHSKKDKTGDAGKNLRALRARCANACMMGAHLQGLSDAQPLGEMMLALVAPVWTAATKDTEGLKFAPLRRIGRSTAPICFPEWTIRQTSSR